MLVTKKFNTKLRRIHIKGWFHRFCTDGTELHFPWCSDRSVVSPVELREKPVQHRETWRGPCEPVYQSLYRRGPFSGADPAARLWPPAPRSAGCDTPGNASISAASSSDISAGRTPSSSTANKQTRINNSTKQNTCRLPQSHKRAPVFSTEAVTSLPPLASRLWWWSPWRSPWSSSPSPCCKSPRTP